MPDFEKLKQLNQPESALPEPPEQTVTVPYLPQVSAIPTDQWNTMLKGQQTTVQRLQDLSVYIAVLPSVDDVNKMMEHYYENVYYQQTENLKDTVRQESRTITESVNTGMEKTRNTTDQTMRNTLYQWETKLVHRDMSPLKIKAKWAGIGALISAMFLLLLKLLKIW